MPEVSVNSSVEWKPSPVVALATSVDNSQVAAAREDGSLEIWLVSSGSVAWHCQLTIHGDANSRVSSLVWSRSSSQDLPSGRLFSSSIDGTVSEWDLFHLKRKTVLDSIGVSIWQMAVPPCNTVLPYTKQEPKRIANGHIANGYIANGKLSHDGDSETSDSEDDVESIVLNEEPAMDSPVALACDDGCVRLYSIYDLDRLAYIKSFARVSGRVLSVAWRPDANMIFSGSSDGFIRCWDVKHGHEFYRITAGLGGLGSGPELCIWSLLALRCGTLVSADSTGSVQFWDSKHGTLLQSHSCHKGDVNALVAAPNHNQVFSAGSDGQVILYKLSTEADADGNDGSTSAVLKKWVYVGYRRAHSHDVRALAVAVPISREDLLPDEKVKRSRGRSKPVDFSYCKWAHQEVPMLISAGDDTKLFAYSAKEFTKFHPHDICPAPQRVPIQLVLNSVFDQTPLLLVQSSFWIDILYIRLKNGAVPEMKLPPGLCGSLATSDLVARVKSKASRKIICSTISTSGSLFAFSDHVKPSLFELKRCEGGKSAWTVSKRQLPSKLPFVHSMVFSSDSSLLILAGHDGRIYVVDVESSKLVHTFTPSRKELNSKSLPSEPPITRMFTSSDGRWLAAINCFGDIYVFSVKTQRQHWFISRLDGASVTAGGFTPRDSNLLVISTSLNQVYTFDVKAKQLGEWSMQQHTFNLPKRFQEYPGEVIGLSFAPSSKSSVVIVYSARAMCMIDLGVVPPVDQDGGDDSGTLVNGHDSAPAVALKKKLQMSVSPINGRRKRKHKLIVSKEEEVDANNNNNNNNNSNKNSGSGGGMKYNVEFCAFKDFPVLFAGHVSEKSVLIIDKPWMRVAKTLDAPPVHRHIYGT